MKGRARCYEEFSGLWCQHNWNPRLFLLNNSVHNLADNLYCDVIPGKSRERMAVRLAGEQVLQSAMAVVYCVAADQTRLGPDRPGRWTPCTCSLRMLQSQHTPLHTTDSPPLQNNQSKSLSDNWSVHCWGDGRESHSLDLVPLCSSDRRRSPHQLPSHPEEARRREGGRGLTSVAILWPAAIPAIPTIT